MYRREALALLGAAMTSAGCADVVEPSAGSPHSLAVGEAHDASTGSQVRVSNVGVRRSVVTPDVRSPDHPDVAAFDDAQFLIVFASGAAASDIAVVLDGTRYPAGEAYRVGDFGQEGAVRRGVRVPVATVDRGAVEWTGGEETVRWTLDDETLASLAAAPRFEVRSFDAPEAVERGSAMALSFTVENVGDRDGRFLAEFGPAVRSDVDEVTVQVAAGETAQYVAERSANPSEEMASVRVVLDWGRDRLQREVRLTG